MWYTHLRHLVRRRPLGLSGTDPRFQAAIEGTKGAVAAGDRGGGLEKGLAGTVMANDIHSG